MNYTFMLIIFSCSVLFLRAQPGTSVDMVVDTMPASIGMDDSTMVQLEMQKRQVASQMAGATITYFVVRAPEHRFGYTIFIDGTMYIEQTSIPAVHGNAGFSTKEDAERVAKLVIEKIRQGEMPPTISMEDLKKLNILY